MNPYYNPEKCGFVDSYYFDEPDLSYEYNTLCFWVTAEGHVYTAEDSGCSCPTPFEDRYDRPSAEEVIQTLERVGSIDQGLASFDSWNKSYIPGQTKLPADDRTKLALWLKEKLKP